MTTHAENCEPVVEPRGAEAVHVALGRVPEMQSRRGGGVVVLMRCVDRVVASCGARRLFPGPNESHCVRIVTASIGFGYHTYGSVPIARA